MTSLLQRMRAMGWRFWGLLVILLAVIIVIIGVAFTPLRAPLFATPTPTPTQVKAALPGKRVVMVISGDLSKSKFWPVVARGAEQAAKDTGLVLELHDLQPVDFTEMSRLIEAAVDSHPDAMVISLPDVKALAPAVKKITDAKIPFIVINSGQKEAPGLGALTYVGQLEYEAGYAAGIRMAEAGVHHAYCVNHQPQNNAVTQRCQGFMDAITFTGGKVDVLVIDRNDLPQTKERITMALQIAPDADGLLITADLPSAVDAVEAAGMQGKVKIASFDFSPATLDAIENGKMLFAIDQQQYLQGYLPLVLLNLYLGNANTVPQEVVATGPGFITQDNAAQVRSLTLAGTR